MCLTVKNFTRRPRRRTGWKVVRRDRRPRHFSLPRNGKYYKGRKVKVKRKDITNPFPYVDIHYGLHVFTSEWHARRDAKYGYHLKIIKVRVLPRNWVADGQNGDAVYTELEVLT